MKYNGLSHLLKMLLAGLKGKGLGTIAATAFLVIVASPVAPQKLPREPWENAKPPEVKKIDAPTEPDPLPKTRRYSRGFPPATVTKTPPMTRAQLQQILDELEDLRIGLVSGSSSSMNYESVARHASEVHCRARRLKVNLELNARPREPANQTVVGNRPVEELIKVLGQNIQRLMTNPVLRQTNVIDAELMAQASKDLDLLIKDSKQLKQLALASLGNSADNRAAAKTPKTAKSRSPYLQLTTSCSLFTPGLFLKRASTVRKSSSEIIDGVRVFVKRHKPTAEEPVSLEECWAPNCSVTEYEDKHALIVKDFYSFEVAGKIFAYAAVYQVARVKDGKLRERFNQTLLLYFVDEEGEGVFELLESGLPLNEVPGWVTGTGP